MAEKLPQTLANHVRWQPPLHFFVLPVTLTALILAIINVVRHYDCCRSLDLGCCWRCRPRWLAPLTRINALKAQDRVIRLEERMRLASILNDSLKSRIGDLTEAQLIALRFCPDAELPGLVDKSMQSNLSGRDIKKSIVSWRADTLPRLASFARSLHHLIAGTRCRNRLRSRSATGYARDQLLDRRQKLTSVLTSHRANPHLAALLEEVDAALERVESGSFGICEYCHDSY